MKCVDPVLCYTDPSGKRVFRHWSLASDIFRGYLHQAVFDCGKCLICRRKKAFELASRCVLHASLYPRNCFLTLTYDETRKGYHNDFCYKDIQDFKKRYRQHVWRSEKRRIEVFNVHEYGRNGKKHWHLIVFGHGFDDQELHSRRNGFPLYTSKVLERLWPFGFSTIGDVSEGSALYQAQYSQKDFQYGHAGSAKKSHSKHAGIGRPYFLLHFEQILLLGFVPFGGRKLPVPRYFEKLADKHFSHFYDPSKFFDLPHRKAVYRPFRQGEANILIADLYGRYLERKRERVDELALIWQEVLSEYLSSGSDPDFTKSGSNALYDLTNKISSDKF